jgi:Nse1 non-SMC component of SMC5-6 complex
MSAIDAEANPPGYQLMAQLLLSYHVMTDEQAYEWYERLQQYENEGNLNHAFGRQNNDDEEEDDGEGGRGSGILGFAPPKTTPSETLDAVWTRINQTLKPFFELEIATAVIKGVRYHSIINTQQDEVIRLEDTFAKRYNAHERAFIRLLLNWFVEVGNDDGGDSDDDDEDDEDDDDEDVSEELDYQSSKKKKSNKKMEKTYALKRSDCINARSELSNNFKLSLDQATRCLDALLDDKYLQVVIDDENDDNGGRHRRRESVHNMLELAPRAYMELSRVLTDDYGMNSHQLPQFLYHRD